MLRQLALFGLALNLISLQLLAQEASSIDLNHPHFSKKAATLFAAGPDHKAIKVKTGDIVLRLGSDSLIAVGTYPVPKDFHDDLYSPEGGNWGIYRMAYTLAKVPGISSDRGLGNFLERSLRYDALTEMGKRKQENIAPELRLSYIKLMKMRGQNKKMKFDDYPAGSPEAEGHAKINGFVSNFYKIPVVDENSEGVVDHIVHYYPGTPFVSHAGIISVEEENGKEKIYIYDAVPGVGGQELEDKRYPSGLRKLSPLDFFGTKEAKYGMIFRVNVTSEEQNIQALESAWQRYHDAQMLDGSTDLFDYAFDWRQDKKVACSAFVWRSFMEGPKVNIASNFNMTLAPAWVVKKVGGYDLKVDLQVAPQTLAMSLYTERLVDFESAPLEEHLKAVSEGKEPLALPSKNERNPETGHILYSTEF